MNTLLHALKPPKYTERVRESFVISLVQRISHT